MKPQWLRPGTLVCTLVFSLPAATASATVLDFETLADSAVVTNQFSGVGVSFQNTVALQAGLSLNDVEFPPHSGDVVTSDNGGPIIIHFATPALSVGGFFTYTTGLTLRAFDGSAVEIDTTSSAFGSNFVSSGNSPNEFLQVASALGIAELTITGDLAGGSFTLDDLTFELARTIPEPSTLTVFGAILVGIWFLRRRQWHNRFSSLTRHS